MSVSLENHAEQVEVLILKGHTDLAAFSVVRFDEDEAANKNRITVKAGPREVELASHAPHIGPKVWRVPVAVTIHLATQSTATMDTIIAAVDSANNSTAPASAVTLATAAFPNGAQIENADGGSRDDSGQIRTRELMLNFIIAA